MTTKMLSKIQTNLSRYAGQWVAFVNGEVVANGETLKELMKKVKDKSPELKVSVFRVPRKDEGPYVLIIL
ncbi:MAG: DUF5678 domain-containing protein [bacterium]|nr:DUF5678 domain-containing protein [bacterium]